MCGKGQGVPRDYARAPMWYNLAASRRPPAPPVEPAADRIKSVDRGLEDLLTPVPTVELF